MTSPSRQRRIALFGLFGVGNIGNEASLAAALEALDRRDANPVVVCGGPEIVSAQHGVPAVPISMAGPLDRVADASRPVRLGLRPFVEVARWLAAIRFARSIDAFVVPGTGILDDFGVSPQQMPLDLLRWSTAARIARRPWFMVGVGAGPIEHPLSGWLMRRTVRNARMVTYRDEASRVFMAGIGEPSPPDVVQPDVAFALVRPADHGADGERPVVGLGLMAYYGWANDWAGGTDTLRAYVAGMAEIARRLIDEGCSLRVLTGEDSDSAAVELLREDLTAAIGDRWEPAVTVAPIHCFRDLLEQVARTDVVVATRYHNVVAGLMMARPTVSIGYAQKFREVMGEFELGDRCHDVDAIDPDEVVADLHAVLADADEIVPRLTERNERYSRAVEARFDQVFDAAFGVQPGSGRGDGATAAAGPSENSRGET